MDHIVLISSEMKNPTVFAHFSLIATEIARCPETLYRTL